MKNHEEKKDDIKKALEKPLNILKQGKWQTLKVGGKKEKVLLQSGEEILARSGIISLEEDLAHLRNQLTVQQPGSCSSVDTNQ